VDKIYVRATCPAHHILPNKYNQCLTLLFSVSVLIKDTTLGQNIDLLMLKQVLLNIGIT